MPDYDPTPDWDKLTIEQATTLFAMVKNRQRLQLLALSPMASEDDRLVWAKAYMMSQWVLEEKGEEILEGIMRFPWTVHVAGAPGMDEDFTCDSEECENPYCGQVQKCSRCHDPLSFGFSAPGLVSEMTAQMMGTSIQKYMASHFGENPMDEEGPTWFPVGTRIAKRSRGSHEMIFLLDDEDDRPEIGPHEFFLDCQVRHEEIARSMGEDDSAVPDPGD